jgi:hypothetical protein
MLSMIRLGSICHGASCDILVPDIILGTLTVTLIDIIHNFMAITAITYTSNSSSSTCDTWWSTLYFSVKFFVFCRPLFVPLSFFPLVIVVAVLFRYKTFHYSFGIFKPFSVTLNVRSFCLLLDTHQVTHIYSQYLLDITIHSEHK